MNHDNRVKRIDCAKMESVGRLALLAAETAADRAMTRVHRLDNNIHSHQERVHGVQETFIGIIPWIKRIVYFWFASSVLLSLSLVQYGMFYIMTVPTHHAAGQLYFDYSVCETHETCSPSKASNVHSCSPVATMDLFMRHAQWEGFHDDVFPQPLASTRVLKQQQPYFMEIALGLPESNANLQAGMFGVAVELLSSNGTALASSIRSARLPHESPWVGVVRKIIWLPGLLVGAFTESRTLLIPSFRNYVESSENPLVKNVVRLDEILWQARLTPFFPFFATSEIHHCSNTGSGKWRVARNTSRDRVGRSARGEGIESFPGNNERAVLHMLRSWHTDALHRQFGPLVHWHHVVGGATPPSTRRNSPSS